MAEQTEDPAQAEIERIPPRRRRRWRIAGAALLLGAGILAYGWYSREELADNLIASQLEQMGLEASYRIESIGARRQVISHVVIGDPARPDLTIERAEITLVPRFPLPAIGRVRLVNPRLYGSYHRGRLSFGSLDKVLFEQPSKEPFSFPDMELALEDGRALLETDYGPVGVKAQGSGHLQGGFAGILAANAPRLSFGDCDARGATLYGKVSIRSQRPAFEGPLRLGSLNCQGEQFALGRSGIQVEARMDRNLAGIEGKAGLSAGALSYAGNRAAKLGGQTRFAWRDDALTAQYRLTADSLASGQLALDTLAAEGSLRSKGGFDTAELQADIEGKGLRPGTGLDTVLADAARAASGTLVGPMLARVRSALAREGRGSALAAEVTLRKTGNTFGLVVPQARLRGASGATLLELSRFQFASSAEGAPRFSGNFVTGGEGLPRISGRMEDRGAGSDTILRLSMAEYRVEGGSLAVPELQVVQGTGGSVDFTGSALVSGAIPGGEARNLALPVKGNWSSAHGLAVWRECTEVAFDRLVLASLAIEKRRLQLCPPRGGAILASDGRGTRVAAGTPALDLKGRLGETPIAIRSGPVGLAWPGNLAARDVDVTLGPPEGATRFRLTAVDARIASDVRGSFSGTDARIFAVPLDVLDAKGGWRYANGRLELTGAEFRLEDREQVDRFNPLFARDATLSLADNVITAHAQLREPKSERVVTGVDIVHDLGTATGHADLAVDGLLFDDRLQPDTITPLALGVVANAKGMVEGKGRVDWDANSLTSTGRFSTSDFDFAAAFGPVQGVSGTIEFTDLLGLVTAPNQHLRISSFNPGIQVDEGELVYELRPDFELVVHGGRWPFIGGALVLEPTSTNLAAAEARRYTLRLEGVDAAQFVERMELANIAATGTFDGTVPLVFDQNGGRIDGGYLHSRAPGGNFAYVGGLTYEDLSPIANFAFDALKSLDYREMEILLDGSLTGEIVTRVRFDGIKQGEAAKQNIITRQLARLPLRFNINIHAPFYKLITALHGMYDPAYVRDPRDVGLLDAAGHPIANPVIKPDDLPGDEEPIQPSESEKVP